MNVANTIDVKVDVLVVGGGVAGCLAAITVARAGYSTLLVERSELIGGNATSSAVGTVCGITRQGESTLVNGGIVDELLLKLMNHSSRKIEFHRHGFAYLPYRIPDFLDVLDSAIQDCRTLTVLLASNVCSVQGQSVDNCTTITNVEIISARNGRMLIFPKRIIDCSGNATITKLAKSPLIEDQLRQECALVCGCSGFEITDERTLLLLLAKESRFLFDKSSSENVPTFVSVVPGSKLGTNAALKFELAETTVSDNTAARARGAVRSFISHLRSVENGFSNLQVQWYASTVGERSSEAGLGQKILTESDVISSRKHDNEIVRGVWPIEWWHRGRVEVQVLPKGEHYSITEEMLKSSVWSNLTFAGRTISATQRALASARVIGTSMATGEAAARIALKNICSEKV